MANSLLTRFSFTPPFTSVCNALAGIDFRLRQRNVKSYIKYWLIIIILIVQFAQPFNIRLIDSGNFTIIKFLPFVSRSVNFDFHTCYIHIEITFIAESAMAFVTSSPILIYTDIKFKSCINWIEPLLQPRIVPIVSCRCLLHRERHQHHNAKEELHEPSRRRSHGTPHGNRIASKPPVQIWRRLLLSSSFHFKMILNYSYYLSYDLSF